MHAPHSTVTYCPTCARLERHAPTPGRPTCYLCGTALVCGILGCDEDPYWRLRDSETGEDLGPATLQQAEASVRTVEGHILIDTDGDIVGPGREWHPGVRRVYVAMPEDQQ